MKFNTRPPSLIDNGVSSVTRLSLLFALDLSTFISKTANPGRTRALVNSFPKCLIVLRFDTRVEGSNRLIGISSLAEKFHSEDSSYFDFRLYYHPSCLLNHSVFKLESEAKMTSAIGSSNIWRHCPPEELRHAKHPDSSVAINDVSTERATSL